MRTLRGILLLAVFLAACTPTAAPSTPPPTVTPFFTVTPTPFQPDLPPTATPRLVSAATPVPPTATPAPTSTLPSNPRLWLDETLPSALRAAAQNLEADFVADADTADVRLTWSAPGAEAIPWVYVLIAPFSTLTDDVSSVQVRDWWRGEWQPGRLYVSEAALAGFTTLWGAPSAAVQPS